MAKPRIVTTHWNLHKQTYSVKEGRAPVYYAASLHLRNCTFIVDARLRALFEAHPNRRTVHALVRGELVSTDAPMIENGERVRCNPFHFAGFRRAADDALVTHAEEIALYADKTIAAKGLR